MARRSTAKLTIAIKEELAWQIAQAMKAQNLSRKRLAERMKASSEDPLGAGKPRLGSVTIVESGAMYRKKLGLAA